MNKAKMFLSLGLVLALVFVAACSGGSKPEATPPQAAESTTEPESVPAGEETPAFDLGGDKIKMAMWWDGAPAAGTELGDRNVAKHDEVKKKFNADIEYITIMGRAGGEIDLNCYGGRAVCRYGSS